MSKYSYYEDKKDEDDSGSKLLGRMFWSVFWIGGALIFAPHLLRFEIFGDPFWRIGGTIGDWFASYWWIFVWAISINLVLVALKGLGEYEDVEPGTTLKGGLILSVAAGIVEELLFRWILFLSACVSLYAFDLLFCGLVSWVYESLMGPLASFGTMGLADSILFHEKGWTVGAAVLSTTALFRDSHRYQGFLGWVDSWFFGIVAFSMLFNYGLLCAMLFHFLFNITTYLTVIFVGFFARWVR